VLVNGPIDDILHLFMTVVYSYYPVDLLLVKFGTQSRVTVFSCYECKITFSHIVNLSLVIIVSCSMVTQLMNRTLWGRMMKEVPRFNSQNEAISIFDWILQNIIEYVYIYIYKRLKWFVKQHQVHKTKW
jgi:hypothetical protein